MEVWSANDDIVLNAELGTSYDASYWYRSNNEITTKAQAAQIRDYHRREFLPWYSDQAIDPPTAADRTPQ